MLRRLARAVFQRFADPELERRYRHEQRSRQARFIRALAYLASAATLVSWGLNFAAGESGAAMAVLTLQLLYVPILLAYAWFAGRPAYAEGWWADIALFVVIQPIILRSVTMMPWPGWPFFAQFSYGLVIAMAFASVAMVAAFAPYAALALASLGYLAAMLNWRDYDPAVASYTLNAYATFAALLVYLNWAIDARSRSLFAARASLAAEREKSEALIGNMLPGPIAERLKQHEAVADGFDEIVVVFVDLVGFTTLSQQLGPARIVELLNAFFSRADRGTDLFGLEKVKTIGDAYMAVAGAITRPPRPHKAAVDFAVWLRREAREVGRGFGVDLRLHVGVASGPAIGGVISAKRLSYDYWGHTVNLAARLQDAAPANGIAVSEAVRRAVGDSYPFGAPRRLELKGVGATPVYDLDLPAR